ncbi:MAG: hypothetical protein NTV29_16285 [Planctomycetota bacterium]|nr:hypothetical protein [Planctomycetota bacterium]
MAHLKADSARDRRSKSRRLQPTSTRQAAETPKFPADGLPNLVVLTLIQPGFRL